MNRAAVASVLFAPMGVPSMSQTPQAPLFAFASPDAAAAWQAVSNGGFASVRSRPRPLGLQTGDTLVARVRGDGREYQLNLYTSGRTTAFSYRAPVKTRSGEWISVLRGAGRSAEASYY